MRHEGGGVPFAAEIPSVLIENDGTGRKGIELDGERDEIQARITAAVNHTLTAATIPQGEWYIDGDGKILREL